MEESGEGRQFCGCQFGEESGPILGLEPIPQAGPWPHAERGVGVKKRHMFVNLLYEQRIYGKMLIAIIAMDLAVTKFRKDGKDTAADDDDSRYRTQLEPENRGCNGMALVKSLDVLDMYDGCH